MKLGIGLPNTMAHETDRRLMLDWARLADDAGFETLGTIDKPNFDSWDPLTTLAGVAGVTERIRLATTILLLPTRNEVLVAKQAAVVDRLSAGRLVLGVAQGAREDDYEIFSAEFQGRADRLEAQVARIREIWAEAGGSDHDHGVLGPAPVQEPGPPIWVGGISEPARARAVRIGDGYVFGSVGPQFMAQLTPWFHVLRYYGQLWTEPENLIHHGPPEVMAEAVQAYADAGIDELILFPEIPRLDQVERLAELVLPAYR